MNSDSAATSAKPTLFLTDRDVNSAFDWRAAVGALRAAYSAPPTAANFPPRSIARGKARWLRTLSGIAPDAVLMGSKQIAANVGAGRVSYLISLFDQESVSLLALLDGNSITGFRTAATSALAADALAPNSPLRVGVIGSGFEARKHVSALAAIRTIVEVRVFSPKPASRLRFVEELHRLGPPIRAVDAAEGAIAGADLVVCAARSRDESPTLRGEWLRPGQTILSIGSTMPDQHEVDSETVARADMVVADMVEEVAHETGDMIAATAAGVRFSHKLVSLSALVGGTGAGRPSPEAIVLYKSVGAALQDLAVAGHCYRQAIALGLGTPLPVSIEPVAK
jgi:ornithine cyclodeaminase/alanine dehydrogenase